MIRVLLLILILVAPLTGHAQKEWLHSNILFNDTSEPFTVSITPGKECFARKCDHLIELVSIERPSDIQEILITRHGSNSNAVLVADSCDVTNSDLTRVQFTVDPPRTGIWYLRIKTCWHGFNGSNDCSSPTDSRTENGIVKCKPGGWLIYKYPPKPTITF